MKIKYGAASIAIALTATFTVASPSYARFTANQNLPKLTRTVPIGGKQICLDSSGDIFVLMSNGNVTELSASGVVKQRFSVKARSIAISPGGTKLYAIETSAHSPSIAVFDTSSGTLINTITSSQFGTPVSLLVSPDGNTLYVLGGARLYAVDLSTGDVGWSVNTVTGDQSNSSYPPNLLMSFSSDGGSILIPGNGSTYTSSGNLGSEFTIVDLSTQTATQEIFGNQVKTTAVIESPSGIIYQVGSSYSNNPNQIVETINGATLKRESNLKTGNRMGWTEGAVLAGNDLLIGGGISQGAIEIFNVSTNKVIGIIHNRQFTARESSSIKQLAYSTSNNTLDVLTSNSLLLYSLASSAPPATPSPSNASNTATYTISLGWNLIDSAIANEIAPATSDFWNGTAYVRSAPSNANGEWVDTNQALTVPVPAESQTSFAIQVAAKSWTMVGNPYSQPVSIVLQSGDAADTYTPGSGYTAVSGSLLMLQPGQGAWLYSASGGSYTIASQVSFSTSTQPPSVPTN
ncbi:MAG: YncE family protein [Bacilli bacterium]